MLISQPRIWATIFMTRRDRRSFVEMCLERNQPVTLEVTVDASEQGRVHLRCTCDKDNRWRLLPNERNPCEWHFQFECLTQDGHSKRVEKLNIDFDGLWIPPEHRKQLALGGCRFFTLSFPKLTSLGWEEEITEHGNYIFSTPPFPPALRSLSFKGTWDGSVTQVNNLISFTFGNYDTINIETIRLFILNNRSLESLEFVDTYFEGTSKGPPVNLFNLKSFRVDSSPKIVSTIVRIPALQRLSSLQISVEEGDDDGFTLHATGDGIKLSTKSNLRDVAEVWNDLTGYARPTIRHVRLHDDVEGGHFGGAGSTALSLLLDAHTLEIGNGYFPFWYDEFLDDLKELGPQLKTIRFAIWDELEPFESKADEYQNWGGGGLLDDIEELVKYRCEQGRPFSAVERMVISKSERSNRQQDYVWRCFYGSRKLSQYVQSV